jgi:hypothetical protein
VAFGLCGLTIDEFKWITPDELYEMAEAKIEHRNADQQYLDALNGIQCITIARRLDALTRGIYASYGANYEIPELKPADFMITRRETEEIEEDPMKKAERIDAAFGAWASMAAA